MLKYRDVYFKNELAWLKINRSFLFESLLSLINIATFLLKMSGCTKYRINLRTNNYRVSTMVLLLTIVPTVVETLQFPAQCCRMVQAICSQFVKGPKWQLARALEINVRFAVATATLRLPASIFDVDNCRADSGTASSAFFAGVKK